MGMKKALFITSGLLGLIVIAVAIWGYFSIYSPKPLWHSEQANKDIYVSSDATYSDWKSLLKDSFPAMNEYLFEQLSEQMNLQSHIYPGRYKIPKKMSLLELNKKFRSGSQDPVKVVIPVKWKAEEVAAIAARQIEADSADIIQALYQLQFEGDQQMNSVYSALIPNTYELYWNTDGKKFAERMKKESQSFWNRNDRLNKASKLGMTVDEVYTLASIVYRETSVEEEFSDIAGVYLNRLNAGIALQADPTVKFAVGDLGLRRILKTHLLIDSPYNTYKYPGLPPGPISLASIQSIDAVLNANDHEYLYFCAKPDSSGRHNFSKTYHAHLINARKFHNWLNSRNIK